MCNLKGRYTGDNKLVYLFLCLLFIAINTNSFVYASCSISAPNKLSAIKIKKAESVNYKKIYDGDTVLLTDGRKIRFIGINTPEIGRRGKPSQPYAKKAKEKLKSLLSSSRTLLLLYDKDKKDHYKRTLAYVYLKDGTDVQGEILRAGLATSIVVQPNDKNLSCYRKIEQQARNQYLGIWKQKNLRPISAEKLNKSKQYRFVTGKVSSVKTRSNSLIIKLDNSVSVKISGQAFKAYQQKPLLGKYIEVRGWVYPFHKKPGMTIYHPENIKVL
jgi:endonuclease YncB( thermonuclease family)